MLNDPITKIGYLAGATRFRRISEKLYVDGDQIYKDAGIHFRASWFSVFYILSQADGPLTILQITDQIDFTHITVKNILRDLQAEGLINISPNPQDKRSKVVTLSAAGRKLLNQLQPLWIAFSGALKAVLEAGHPDISNILNRIDDEIHRHPIHQRVKQQAVAKVQILDYRPGLKEHFARLAEPWLRSVLNGTLEEDDKFTLFNPDRAYLDAGGFLFFASYQDEIVGCVALKRLDEDSFEFAKLFIEPRVRQLGLATRLIERCIGRCKENYARELWLQTTMAMPQAHRLYCKLGFGDRPAPPQMDVLVRTEKIMCRDL